MINLTFPTNLHTQSVAVCTLSNRVKKKITSWLPTLDHILCNPFIIIAVLRVVPLNQKRPCLEKGETEICNEV